MAGVYYCYNNNSNSLLLVVNGDNKPGLYYIFSGFFLPIC